jgi:oligogalacturonide transport system permease protein
METRKKIAEIMKYTILIFIGFLMLYPMLWMVGSSFKSSNAEIFSSISILPKNPTFDAYKNGWFASNYQYGRYMINTFLFVIPKVLGTVLSCVMAAYAFTRFSFRSQKLLFGLCISTLFLPQVVLNIPQFLLFNKLGWLDSFKPLVIPSFFAVDTYFVFILVQFMRTIPMDLDQAAFLDGCNSLQRLRHVMVPMTVPAIESVVLFQFMWSSNDFQGPLIYLNSVSKYPSSLGLRLIMDAESGFEWNKVLAMSVVTILPSIIVFFLAQDSFVDGITAGGIKG